MAHVHVTRAGARRRRAMMPGALIITQNTRLDVAQVPTTAQHAHLRELERVANELRSRESHDDDESSGSPDGRGCRRFVHCHVGSDEVR